MRLSRTGKLIRNVLLVICLLVFLWSWEGQPLPLRMDYRRAEKGHFLSEKQIVLEDKNEGWVVSIDKNAMYLFSQNGWWIPDGSIVTCPVEDGLAWGIYGRSGEFYTALVAVAHEAGGEAVTARLRYGITPMEEETERYVYEVEAERENGIFLFPIRYQDLTEWENGQYSISGEETTYIEDVFEWHNGLRIMSDYTLTMEFYDADGSLVAAFGEEGGISHED